MPSLRELQQKVSRALKGADRLNFIIAATKLAADKRLAIYQNNISACLTNSLEIVYPCIGKLVGDNCFKFLCALYAKQYCSTSGNLDHYGENFADFLATNETVAPLTYLPDIARLEWAYQQATYAKDYVLFDSGQLTKLNADQYSEIIFQINPACCSLNSIFPLTDIWNLCQQTNLENAQINLSESNRFFLVFRKGYTVNIEMLSEAQALFFKLLFNQNTLALAVEQVLKKEETFNFTVCLQKYIEDNIIVGFKINFTNKNLL